MLAMHFLHGSYASRAWLLFAASRRGAQERRSTPRTDKTRLEVTTTTATATTTTTTIKG